MKSSVHLFMFIDAMGWEVIKDRSFLEELLPHRYPVQMQYGYSCTAIPTILTGQPPTGHKHLTLYYYNPATSPFRAFRFMKFLPKQIFDRWRVRHQISKFIAKYKSYTGYFEMYSMPFDRIQYFDYIEKKDIFVPGGLAPTPNLADELVRRNIPYHISNWRLSEEQNINALIDDLNQGDIRFAFLYTAAMDSLLHMVTKDGKEITPKLQWYASRIEQVLDAAHKNYDNVELSVFSDHGMTTLTEPVDARKVVEQTTLKFGKDYVAHYNSTMAHFWYLQDAAGDKLRPLIQQVPYSHLLSDEEKKRYGIDFDDAMYGHDILLMDAGYQIAPCDMGLKALPGMHGFAPEHPDSFASFLSNVEPPLTPQWVGDYFSIMTQAMDRIQE